MSRNDNKKQPDFFIAPLEVFQDHRLTLMQTRVLLALFSYRNKQTNVAHPKRETLAERSGYGVGVISRTTTQLVKLGWLKKTGDGGKRRASSYEVIVPDLSPVTVTEPVTVTDSVTVTEPDTQTVTDPVTPRVTDSVRGNKEQNIRTEQGTEEKRNKKETAMDFLPDGMDESLTRKLLDHRKILKKPVTMDGLKLLVKAVDRTALKLSISHSDIVDEMLEAGWLSVKPEWIMNRRSDTARPKKADKIQRNGFEQNEYLETI